MKGILKIRTLLVFVLTILCLLTIWGSGVDADSSSVEKVEATREVLLQKAGEGVYDPLTGSHLSYRGALYFESPEKNLRFRLGAKIIIDAGRIEADEELETAFPDLKSSDIDPRAISIITSGEIFKKIDFKFEIDFADTKIVQDNWIRFSTVPFLRHTIIGHMKEPSSLDWQTGIHSITFLERALPVNAFSHSRNLGIRYDRPGKDHRITWSGGFFLETGSLDDLAISKSEIDEASGYNLVARLTGLPWYEEGGRKLLHLGLSYTHGIRDDQKEDWAIRVRAWPEARLFGERFVDTGTFLADSFDYIGAELALVSGPVSFQSEYMYMSTDADSKGDPAFWGCYGQMSFLLTGEHRNYNRSNGAFVRLAPAPSFNPLKGNWGSWEIGLRCSYLDLNDAGIAGGKETNLTAGLNWYLKPNVRFMFNNIYALVKDRASPYIENGRADVIQGRFQIIF
jgi:phosphate-selective porin OprO/OprP